MASSAAPRDRNGFKIAIFCALPLEAESVRAVFDRCWDGEGRWYGKAVGDKNTYTTGAIGRYNVVLVHMPTMGSVPAAQAGRSLSSSFPNIILALVVGVCGVVPLHPKTKEEIVLGDVIISTAMTQYDYGRRYPGEFQIKDTVEDSLRKAPEEVQGFINKLLMRQSREKLRADLALLIGSERFQRTPSAVLYPGATRDRLYEASYSHRHRLPIECDTCRNGVETTCSRDCDQIGCEEDRLVLRNRLSCSSTDNPELRPASGPAIHLGRFGSANTVIKSGVDRDRLAARQELSAFEMEGAGVWNEHPTIVIKGACDYADSHKDKDWQPYAAMVAALCLKVVLKEWVVADELMESARSIWHVPYGRMSGFIGRSMELVQLKQKIFNPDGGRLVSVLGLGGVGKSRLTLELAYHIRSEHPQCSVFWIQGATQSTFETDVRDVGKQLGISGIDDEKADVKGLVKRWLNDRMTSYWVLILDNADDEQLWGRLPKEQRAVSSLVEWLPNAAKGSIVVTTRTRGIANYLAGKEVIEVTEMPPNQAVDMFTSGLEKHGLAGDETTVSQLVKQLAYLPLAIVQASSFINRTQVTASAYLELLDQTEEDVIELLRDGFDQPFGHERTLRPVATTWWVSFQHIRDHHPLVATYLSWMACLNEKGIPLSLLPPESPVKVAKAIGTLVGYSFIKKHGEGDGVATVEPLYDMHRLVHLCTRNWLQEEGQLAAAMEDCIRRVAKLFPTGNNFEDKDRWTLYFPHGESLCQDRNVRAIPDRYKLLDNMATCLFKDGKYREALRSWENVVEWKEKELGVSHPETLKANSDLGKALSRTGDLSKAEALQKKVIKGMATQLGLKHRDTLLGMGNLASIYRQQGRYKEAEELEVNILGISRDVLGPRHPDTLASMSSLAMIYRQQGRYKEAEELEVKVLETIREILGPRHPNTLVSIGNLATIYRQQGRYKEAEELEVEVLETRREILGPRHPNTLVSMGNLATVYMEQGRIEKAEELYIKVLETKRIVLGPRHPSTLVDMSNLATVYRKQGRIEKAEELYIKVLEAKKTVLGPEHPETLTSMGNLATVYWKQGRIERAEELDVKVLEMRREVLGPEHPDTLASMANLARTLMEQKRKDEAVMLMTTCARLQKKVLGPEHHDTEENLETLAAWKNR